MKPLLIAATVAAVATPIAFATPASAQSREYRREMRECNRELSRADSRSEYRRELRECRRELARAQRYGRSYYRYGSNSYYNPYRSGYSYGSNYYSPYYGSSYYSPYGYGYDPYYRNGVSIRIR